MKSIVFALLLLSLVSLAPAHAALSPATRVVLDEAALTGGGGQEADQALASLKKRPRADVVKALREGLSEGGGWVAVVARAAQSLEEKELLPELLKTAQTVDDWRLLAAVESLSRGTPSRVEVEALFARKLATATSPSKIVMLEVFSDEKSQLSAPLFDSLLSDKSTGVRRAVVRQFLATRESYPREEQIRRFKLAFTVKPYQARLEALQIYAALPEAQRRSIASAFDPSLCGKESNAQVKLVCNKLAKGAK